MPAIDPLHFFLLDKPGLLIDIRPKSAFDKGTLGNAISMQLNEQNPVEDFQRQIRELKSAQPLYLIDLDGTTSKIISKTIPLLYLEGGYQLLKTRREQAFKKGPSLRILGGYTGSGKTDLLHHLKTNGHQIIDLESLASHKGSVFGYSENPQPLHEEFQNNLLLAWLSLNPEQKVWIEEKGPFLGKVGLPKTFYDKMLLAPLTHLDISFEERLINILQTYGKFDPTRFKSALRCLEDRMGTRENHKALHYLGSGQIEKCFELLLKYYDKAYEKRRQATWVGEIIRIPHSHSNLQETLEFLV